MRIVDQSVYVGPSLYAHFPVIRLGIDLGPLEEWPSGKLGPAFTDPLIAALPGLHEHGCSYGEPGGFIRRLTEGEGTWMGHILEHVAIELQNVAGEPVTFGKTAVDRRARPLPRDLPVRAGGRRARGRPAWPHAAPLAAAAGAPARGRGSASISISPASATSSSASPSGGRSGPSTASLVRAAEERRIPWIRLNDQSLIQFGHGRYQQRIQATVTSRTSHIAVELASDKEETNQHPRPPRAAGPAPAAGAERGRRGDGGGAHRLPGGGQAVQRQPRPRHLDPADHGGAGRDRRSTSPGSTAAA